MRNAAATAVTSAIAPLVAWSRAPARPVDLRAHLASLERAVLVLALERTRGNQTYAAALLALSRRTLIVKLERHGLKPAPATASRPRRARTSSRRPTRPRRRA